MSRRWMMVALPFLWLAVLAAGVAVVNARYKARALFVQLEQLSAERDRLNIEWRQLQLEQSTWSNYGFVERVATDKLRFKVLNPDEVRIVAP